MDVKSTPKTPATVSEREVALFRDQENLIAHVRDIAVLEVESRMLLANVDRIERVIRLAKNHDSDLEEETAEMRERLGAAAGEHDQYRKKVRRRATLAREVEEAEEVLVGYETELDSTERRLSRFRVAAHELRENIGVESKALGGVLDMEGLDVELAAAAATAAADAAQHSGEDDGLAATVRMLERKVAEQAAEIGLQARTLKEQAEAIAHLMNISSNPEHWWRVMTR